MPKAIYYRNAAEIKFYETYFDNVRILINDLESIDRIEGDESERCAIAAIDALHVAAAHLAKRSKHKGRVSLPRISVFDTSGLNQSRAGSVAYFMIRLIPSCCSN